MFDAALAPPLVQDWRDQLSHGDVVALTLPTRNDPADRPEPGPWLVLEINRVAGRRFALVAPGIPAASASRSGYDVPATRREVIAAAGLAEPTCFDGSRRLLISLASSRFHLGNQGSPLLGRLPEGEIRRMNRIRARILAEADIAADRRERRRAAPRPTLAAFGDQGRRAGGAR